MVIRSCLTSIFLNFWKGLISRRYPFPFLQHSKNNKPLLQGVFFLKFDVVGCFLVFIVQILLFIPFNFFSILSAHDDELFSEL